MCHVIYTDLEALRVAAALAAAPIVGERRERHADRRVGRRGGPPAARAAAARAAPPRERRGLRRVLLRSRVSINT